MTLKASKIEQSKANFESVKSAFTLLQASRHHSFLIQINNKLDMITTSFTLITETSSDKSLTQQRLLNAPQSSGLASGTGWKDSTRGVSKPTLQWKANFLLGTFSYKTSTTTYRYDDSEPNDDTNNSTTIKTFVVEFLMGFTTCRKSFRVQATNSCDHYSLDAIRQQPSNSPIFQLCADGNVQAVRMLLDRGQASVHDVDERGLSLLHMASSCSNSQLCKMLLQCGADVYLKSNDGITPIDFAVLYQQVSCCIAIIEAGFDLWPLSPQSGYRFFCSVLPLSVWRYIHIIKPTTVGTELILMQIDNIIHATDVEMVDFLSQRVHEEELFQLGKFGISRYIFRGYLPAIYTATGNWLHRLTNSWFLGMDFEFLPEYKLTKILKNLSRTLNSITDQKSYSEFRWELTDILSHSIKQIVISCCWSTEVCNGVFRRWSEMFLDCGIVLHAIIQQTMGTNALEMRIFSCCRALHFEVLCVDQHDDLFLKVDNTIAPKFSHLDPLFLCEVGRPRRDRTGPGRCLSLIPETLIKDGRFCMKMPGQWEEPLVSNSELVLQVWLIKYDYPARFRVFHSTKFQAYSRGITEADF